MKYKEHGRQYTIPVIRSIANGRVSLVPHAPAAVNFIFRMKWTH